MPFLHGSSLSLSLRCCIEALNSETMPKTTSLELGWNCADNCHLECLSLGASPAF